MTTIKNGAPLPEQITKAQRAELIAQQNEKILNSDSAKAAALDESSLNKLRIKSQKEQDAIIDLAYKSERATFETKNACYMFIVKYLRPVNLRVKDYFTFFEQRIIEKFTAKSFEDLEDGVTDNVLNKDELVKAIRRVMLSQEQQVFKKAGLDENGNKLADGATRTPDQQRGAEDTPAIKAKNILTDTSYDDLEQGFFMLKKERQLKLIGLFFKQLSAAEQERLLWDLVADKDNIEINIK